MSDSLNIFQSEYLTNISNYSGIFQTGVSYKKFDFVHNTGDGLFYYARQDISYGGGAQISGGNRLSLIPDGPYTSEGDTHFIVDSQNQLQSLGTEFKVGQIVNLQGSTGTNDGSYRIVSIENDLTAVNYDTSITGAAMTVIGLTSSDSIDTVELESANHLILSEVNLSPSENDDAWSKDLFFFDADYGSNVNFKANNSMFSGKRVLIFSAKSTTIISLVG